MVPLFLQLVLLLTGFARAEDIPYRIEVKDLAVQPGAKAALQVVFTVPPGFHTYRDQVEVTVIDAGGLTFSAPDLPPGVMKDDLGQPGQKRETYVEDVWVDVPFVASKTPGRHTVALHTRYQGCKKSTCYFPYEQELTAVVTVGAKAAELSIPGIGAAYAQEPAADPATELDVVFTGKAGAPNTATIAMDLHGDWHVNKAFVNFTLVEPVGYTFCEPSLPAGEKSGDAAAGTEREDYAHDLDFSTVVYGPVGTATLKVDVGYQACKGVSLCKMPDVKQVEIPVVIDASAPTSCPPVVAAVAEAPPAAPAEAAPVEAAAAPKTIGASEGFAAAQEKGVMALVLLCFLAGIGVSFTPCVLPMIPITMGLIGARGAGSRFTAFTLAATYVAGLAIVYSGLGVFAGVTGALFGSWLQSKVVVFGIAGFFFVMGFSMFGFFEVGVPSFISSRMHAKKGGGYLGALVLGFIGAVLAGPCSGPVVASILALIGSEGKVGLGAGLMFSFSLGMGMIFLVTGAASGWLPPRGGWMDTVKKGFGIILWLGAIYYAAPHLSTTVTALFTAGVLLTTAVFGWPHPDDGEETFMVRLRQLYSIGGGIIGAYLLLGTLLQQGFILPPMSMGAGASSASAPKIAWVRTEAEALDLAKKSGKPLFIDFTAEWCAACHEMEKFTYTDARIIAESDKFVTVMLDCTEDNDPAIVALQKKYGVSGLPTVVFVSPDGKTLGGTVGFVEADDFLPKMKAALEANG